jgi:predicted RNA-binding protein
MCLAKAYLRKDDGDEAVMANVASAEVSGDSVVLTTILRERKVFEAQIESVDFANGSITLRPVASAVM